MKTIKMLAAVTVSALAIAMATASFAADKAEIKLQRFFGACDADFGANTDVAKAVGECGIITSLINKFNATSPDAHISVTTVEWPGYDQLNAQFAAGDPPDLVTIHESALSDYQSKGLILPLNDLLKTVGVTPDQFTEAAQRGATKASQLYGMPIDTWTMLFHVNMDLFKQAGLVDADGKPIFPKSPDEFIAQAEQFKAKTGKPYLIQYFSNETALFMRNFYTYLFQQNSDFFADPKHVKFNTPEGKRVVEMFKKLYDENLTTKALDYSGAINAFLGGEGGVHMNGTWVVGDYDAQAKKPGTALNKGGYEVYPYPQLFGGAHAQYADGHTWAVSNANRTPAQTAAIAEFLKFYFDNDFEWSRTGHLPSVQAVIDSEKFRALPHRSTYLAAAKLGQPLPSEVQRQFAIQDIIGEELVAGISGQKSVDAALSSAEKRVNDLLGNL